MDAARKAADFYGTEEPEQPEENVEATPICKKLLLYLSDHVLAEPAFYKPMIVAAMIHLSQQLSGINAIMFYSTSIFISAGVGNAGFATVFVGVINIVFTGIR